MEEKKVAIGGDEIDFFEFVSYVWRRKVIVAFFTIIAAIVAYVYTSYFVVPIYQSEAWLYVINSNDQTSKSDLEAASQFADDYQKFLYSNMVLKSVIEKLNLDFTVGALSSRISVTNPDNTRIIKIVVSDADPVLACNIANTICEVSREKIIKLLKVEDVTQPEIAEVAKNPSSPSVIKNIILFAFAGFAVSVGILILMKLVNNKIMTSQDVEQKLGVMVLGSIPYSKSRDASESTKKNNKKGTSTWQKQ